MPEDVTRDLRAFTPVGLDREAVLFAAGMAAARRWAGWKWLAVVLAVSNAVTLAVLVWPRPVPSSPPPAEEPTPPLAEPSEQSRPDPYSLIALRQGWDAPPPTGAGGTPALPSAPLTPRAIHDQSW